MRKSILSFVCGALVTTTLFAGYPALAAGLEATINAVRIKVGDQVVAEVGESFSPGGVSVPTSISYKGTTYLPIRKISETLKRPIEYDASTKTISISHASGPYRIYPEFSNVIGVPDFGDLTGLPIENKMATDNGFAYLYDLSNTIGKYEMEYANLYYVLGWEFLGTDYNDDGEMNYYFTLPVNREEGRYINAIFGDIIMNDGRKCMYVYVYFSND